MKKFGHGVFAWDGEERRSNRYGSFILLDSPYGDNKVTDSNLSFDITELEGKRVRITCKVVATRKSGHIGDMFLHILPSTPELGEEIVLGVGVLKLKPCSWAQHPVIILAPEKDRQEFWMDPRVLYRLHDQTVDVFVEETNDPCSPVPVLNPNETGVELVEVCDEDSIFQTKRVEHDGLIVEPNIESLGGGMFVIGPHKVGARVKHRHDK